jgi:hypothetical protein
MQTTDAATSRWQQHRETVGETINQGAARLGIAYRTANRWKASGRLVLQNKMWIERDRATIPVTVPIDVAAIALAAVAAAIDVSVVEDVAPVTVPIEDEEDIEDAAQRLNISLRTAFSWRDAGKLKLQNGLWSQL